MLPSTRAAWLLGLVLFATAWSLLQPPLPQLPNSDLFTHLAVAENLADGRGFVTHIVYPVSLAFPFATQLPQPLLHRQPGYPVLLLGPTWLGGGEPQQVLAWVHRLQLGLMIVLAWLGLIVARRAGCWEVVPAWWLTLLLNPCLGMTAGWGLIEIPTALILLWLWQRMRPVLANPDPARPDLSRAAVDGVLAGALTLLRLDLVWIPVLWWLVARRRFCLPAALVAVSTWLLVTAPWCARNATLTGQPFFNLQAYAEHLKETPTWPGYSIYRSLSPESIVVTAVQRPGILVAKARSGLRFFAGDLGRWLPWSLWGWLLVALFWHWRRGGDSYWRSPLGLALGTCLLLMVQYAFFSHSLRHLVVVLPVVALEICLWLGQRIRQWQRRLPRAWCGALLAGLLGLCHIVTPLHLPGWENTLLEAHRAQAGWARNLSRVADTPPGPIFCDSAALLWRTGRSGVWLPLDDGVTTRIRQLVPALATAPTILTLDAAPDSTAGQRH